MARFLKGSPAYRNDIVCDRPETVEGRAIPLIEGSGWLTGVNG